MMKTSLPKHCIVDVGRVIVTWRDSHYKLFEKVPVEALLTTVTSIPVYSDCNEALWHTIEQYLADDPELMDSDELDMAESVVVELLLDDFYMELDKSLGNLVEHYVFERWLDKHSILLQLHQ